MFNDTDSIRLCTIRYTMECDTPFVRCTSFIQCQHSNYVVVYRVSQNWRYTATKKKSKKRKRRKLCFLSSTPRFVENAIWKLIEYRFYRGTIDEERVQCGYRPSAHDIYRVFQSRFSRERNFKRGNFALHFFRLSLLVKQSFVQLHCVGN